MKGSLGKVSVAHSMVCPACEIGELRTCGPERSRCDFCGCLLDGAMLEVLRQIVALPGAIGAHACECGHPKMRELPDGVLHCPACGSEVGPFKSDSNPGGPAEQRSGG